MIFFLKKKENIHLDLTYFETHIRYNFQPVKTIDLSEVLCMTENMYIFAACINVQHIDCYIVSKGYNAVFFYYDLLFDMRT